MGADKLKPASARWLSGPFIIFYIIIGCAVFSVLSELLRVSDANERYQHLLSPGWLFGKRQMVSDGGFVIGWSVKFNSFFCIRI